MRKRLTKRVVRKYLKVDKAKFVSIEKTKDGYIAAELMPAPNKYIYTRFYNDGTVYMSFTKETCNRSPFRMKDWR